VTAAVQRRSTTQRIPNLGLVTRARVKHRYARMRPDGKVHVVEGAVIRWDRGDNTFVLLCDGRQPRRIFPAIPSTDLCAKCVRALTEGWRTSGDPMPSGVGPAIAQAVEDVHTLCAEVRAELGLLRSAS